MQDIDFEEAIKKHRRAVMAYAYTCSKDLALAEDIVQETCLTAYKKRDTYRPDANFGSWLIAIARFVWLRECEKRGIRSRAMTYLHENASTMFTPELYEEEQWQAEKKALKRCMKKLKDSDRHLLEDHFIQGLKYDNIARKVERTLTWVKVRMFRLREALRKCIQGQLTSEERLPS